MHLLDQTKQSTTSQINFRLIGLGQKAFIWSDSYSYSVNWLTLLRLIQSDRKLTTITISFREFMGPWAPKSHLDYAPIFFLFVVFLDKAKGQLLSKVSIVLFYLPQKSKEKRIIRQENFTIKPKSHTSQIKAITASAQRRFNLTPSNNPDGYVSTFLFPSKTPQGEVINMAWKI